MNVNGPQGKIEVEIGEQLANDLMTGDGSVVLCKAGTVVTPELLEKLSKWIVEKGAGNYSGKSRERIEEKKSLRRSILKKLDFQETISQKTREEIGKDYSKFFSRLSSRAPGVSASEIASTVEQIVENTTDDSDTPIRLFEMKQHSSYIYHHSLECGIMAAFFAGALNYSKEDTASFVTAMMFHDVGMLDVPAGILQKIAPLSPEEWEIIRKHPAIGWDRLGKIPGMDPVAMLVCRGHHVFADGSGYPADSWLGDLPPLAHLAALIDHFEAMISTRPYRGPGSLRGAVKMILSQREKYFPAAFENFMSIVGIYPVSTMLLLLSGEVGVVVKNNPENLFLPYVKLVLDPAGAQYTKEIFVNLADDPERKPVQAVDDL